MIIIRPAVHDSPALEGGIDVAADGVPRLGAERNAFGPAMVGVRRMGKILIGLPRFHQRSLAHMPEIVLAVVPAEDELIADVKTRAFPAEGIRAVLLLQFWVKLLVQNGHLYLIGHNKPPCQERKAIPGSLIEIIRQRSFKEQTVSTCVVWGICKQGPNLVIG
jgi:hypothetical protein